MSWTSTATLCEPRGRCRVRSCVHSPPSEGCLVVGPLLSLYAIYLAFVGIREVHGTTTGKAALVVLVPVGAILLLALLVRVTLGAMQWRS